MQYKYKNSWNNFLASVRENNLLTDVSRSQVQIDKNSMGGIKLFYHSLYQMFYHVEYQFCTYIHYDYNLEGNSPVKCNFSYRYCLTNQSFLTISYLHIKKKKFHKLHNNVIMVRLHIILYYSQKTEQLFLSIISLDIEAKLLQYLHQLKQFLFTYIFTLFTMKTIQLAILVLIFAVPKNVGYSEIAADAGYNNSISFNLL